MLTLLLAATIKFMLAQKPTLLNLLKDLRSSCYRNKVYTFNSNLQKVLASYLDHFPSKTFELLTFPHSGSRRLSRTRPCTGSGRRSSSCRSYKRLKRIWSSYKQIQQTQETQIMILCQIYT